MNPGVVEARLRADVEAIAYPGGRLVGTPEHERAARYLVRRLEETGCRPYAEPGIRLDYRAGVTAFANLIGVIPGSGGGGEAPLLVAAHYDSAIAGPSADDNAAAVAIALEVGRTAAQELALRRDLVLALFDAEEPPHFQQPEMGSNHFHAHQMDRGTGVHAAIVMDLVGHDVPQVAAGGGLGAKVLRMLLPDLRDLLFITGAESHPALPALVESLALPKGLRIAATLNRYVGDMSDHGVFRKNGAPYLFLSCGRWEHYHAPTDTPDRLNYGKMAATAAFVWQTLTRLDAAALPQGAGEGDTLGMEIRQLQAVLGPLLLAILGHPARTREDVTRVVGALMSAGL